MNLYEETLRNPTYEADASYATGSARPLRNSIAYLNSLFPCENPQAIDMHREYMHTIAEIRYIPTSVHRGFVHCWTWCVGGLSPIQERVPLALFQQFMVPVPEGEVTYLREMPNGKWVARMESR